MHYIDGKMLKALREKRNMTQTALAERLHVSDKAISKWETGRGFPDISILDELGKALQIIKLYPEQTAEARFIRKGHGTIYAYEVRNGLYQMKI